MMGKRAKVYAMEEKAKSAREALLDSELIRGAAEDPEIFGSLMERYADKLARYVRRLTLSSDDDVDDILQETFVKAYLNLADYDERLLFSSWLYRIAHNQSMDHLRRTKVRPRPLDLESLDWARLIADKADLAREVAGKDCALKIQEALADMPAEQRDALVLRFLEEKSYEEIMDILKKPKGTVATLIARGRKKLRALLRERGVNCRD